MTNVKNVLYWLAVGLVVASALRLAGPAIETWRFPVYSKFEIVSANTVDEDHVELVFWFNKLRNCEARGATWSNGEFGQSFDVEIGGQTSPTPRPMGPQLSRPYTFEASELELRRGLVAIIRSQCPFIPWETRSIVYP